LDSAFNKLDYAKSRVIKSQNIYSSGTFDGKAGIKKEIAENQLLLDYFLTEDSIFAFIVFDNHLELLRKPINLKQLEEDVLNYQILMQKTIEIYSKYDRKKINDHVKITIESSYKLAKDLLGWESLREKIQKSEILRIIPDEFLFNVPFATLLLDTLDRHTYLIEKIAISYVPSNSFALNPMSDNRINRKKNRRVLVSANKSIPGVSNFIKSIKGSFENIEEIELSKPPDKSEIIEKMNNDYDAIFFIGHSSPNMKSPSSSFIEVAVYDKSSDNVTIVPFLISDFEHTKWTPSETIVLLGCKTAKGKLYKSVGMVGLQNTFLMLGSKNVIGTLWDIDAKQSTNQLLNCLKFIQNDDNPVKALQKMQIAAIDVLSEHKYFSYPHPYFWGSYTIYSIYN
jgi:CHAT domain-containing protein